MGRTLTAELGKGRDNYVRLRDEIVEVLVREIMMDADDGGQLRRYLDSSRTD